MRDKTTTIAIFTLVLVGVTAYWTLNDVPVEAYEPRYMAAPLATSTPAPCLTTMSFNRLPPFSGRADTVTATVKAYGVPTYTSSQDVPAGQVAVVFENVPCPVASNNPVSVTLEGTGWKSNQVFVATVVDLGGGK